MNYERKGLNTRENKNAICNNADGGEQHKSDRLIYRCIYRVILKKVSLGILRIIMISKEEKKIYYGKQRQRAISEQVFVIFDHCHQN